MARNKGKGVFFRLSEEEYQQWTAIAERDGMTLPEFAEHAARRLVRTLAQPETAAGDDLRIGMVQLALRAAGADASLIASVLAALRPAPASPSSAQGGEGGNDE